MKIEQEFDAKLAKAMHDIHKLENSFEKMAAQQTSLSEWSKQFEQNLDKITAHLDRLQLQFADLDRQKLTIEQHKTDQQELKDIIYRVHTVMDYFSNEFLRVENFLEKYLPLKVQNQISHTLNYVIEPKSKWRLRDYEDQKFMELREHMLEDRGLPDIEGEVKNIIEHA